MGQFESEELKLHELKIRVQNLRVLLEEAVFKGYHDRMKQLVADIREAEAAVSHVGHNENNQSAQSPT